jgi:hypothetical protein
MGQKVCGYRCAAKVPKIERKAEKAKDRATRERLKTRSQWAKEAEREVNRYVRFRDHNLGCISCSKPASWQGQWHASHFRSVGAASALRFNLWNIHKSCSECNKWKSGNLSEYEPRLRELIGDQRVDWLRTQNQLVTYSIDYLKRLKSVFAKKAMRINERRAVEACSGL